MRKLYFAYGSNMNPVQMRIRCPESRAIAKAKINGYRIAINSRGVATIIPDAKGYVSGVVWGISRADEARLDVFEGVKIGFYLKKSLNIHLSGGRNAKALVYIDKNYDIGMPRKGYLERIIKGAEFFGFEDRYISKLERLAYA